MEKHFLLLINPRLVCDLTHARHVNLWIGIEIPAATTFEPPPTQAAVSEAWVQRYNGPANQWGEARPVAVKSIGARPFESSDQ